MLDRGEQLDWFSSGEIQIEALICVCSLYILLVHTFTGDNPFVNPRVFLDRNFAVCTIIIFSVGLSYYAAMALMAPYLQTLMDYPVVTAGIVMGPRGIGTMLFMFIVGRLIGKVDTRIILLIGFGLTAWSLYDMTGWTPDVSQQQIIVTGFVQGAGLGFLFVPVTTAAFTTLDPALRGDGTGLYNLSRNLGSSVGISLTSAMLVQNAQVTHAELTAYVTPFNPTLRAMMMEKIVNPLTAAGQTMLDGLVSNQAMIISYIDDFKLMMIITLAISPLVFLLKKGNAPAKVEHSAISE